MRLTKLGTDVRIEHDGEAVTVNIQSLQRRLNGVLLAPQRMTTAAAARLVGVSSSTMLRAVQAKKIKSFKTPGGHFRLDPEAVVKFFNKG